MNAEEIKQKILSGQISDEELSALLKKPASTKHKKTFFNDLLKGFIDGYTTPNLWKLIIESFLIFIIIISAAILTYAEKMETTTTAILFAAVLGFLFGKLR